MCNEVLEEQRDYGGAAESRIGGAWSSRLDCSSCLTVTNERSKRRNKMDGRRPIVLTKESPTEWIVAQ